MTIAPSVEAVPTGTWASDPIHSTVGFAVRHMGLAPFRGGFKDFDATISDGRLVGSARVESITTDDETLTGHLLSPDFFDAERNPEITFTSSSVDVDGDELVVDGELTIKGTTRPVEAHGAIVGPVSHPAGGERIGIDLETTVDRRDFGLNWNAELPKGGVMVENAVTLNVHLELAKEE